MIIISWLRRSFGIRTNLERLINVWEFLGKELLSNYLQIDLEEWFMVKMRRAMSKLHGKIKVLG